MPLADVEPWSPSPNPLRGQGERWVEFFSSERKKNMLYNPITGESKELASSNKAIPSERPQGESTIELQQVWQPNAVTVMSLLISVVM